jgi:hypothetical protein
MRRDEHLCADPDDALVALVAITEAVRRCLMNAREAAVSA